MAIFAPAATDSTHRHALGEHSPTQEAQRRQLDDASSAGGAGSHRGGDDSSDKLENDVIIGVVVGVGGFLVVVCLVLAWRIYTRRAASGLSRPPAPAAVSGAATSGAAVAAEYDAESDPWELERRAERDKLATASTCTLFDGLLHLSPPGLCCGERAAEPTPRRKPPRVTWYQDGEEAARRAAEAEQRQQQQSQRREVHEELQRSSTSAPYMPRLFSTPTGGGHVARAALARDTQSL